ncbi:short-chain fatty acyl-CoA regulator family protein [Brevundimonas naejangsanensis]|uniref:short-chain fatty acyl-CoA regulator family protein n=1 Tax=Brevundimonas naejangsanensis TaxID=588932 RepID=UPI000EB857E6|nr:short-chain fatty acyl-CoA regulator family protein [Brevundimonas naejangsanensis]RJT23449.1 helix-turn-helix domain-containing protein [Chakrabartia godavariana]HAC00738.1 Cro/Cl family transcriptional regulator [Brevundimonas sp.]HCW49227.1 Cro/Cl family transcriptional regulator [Brevundimonas sp.]
MSKTFMGVRLRRLREERGLTQTAVARALDISNSYLSQIEQNQRPLTVPLLLKLNAVFGVDVQFFSEDEEGRLISDVRDALADGGDEPISTVELRELALNMPAVGRALVSLHRKARQSAERAEIMALRLGEDAAREAPARMPFEQVRDFFYARRNHVAELDEAAERLYAAAGLAPRQIRPGLAAWLAEKHGVRVIFDETDEAQRRYDGPNRTLYVSAFSKQGRQAFQMALQLAFLEAGDLIESLIDAALLEERETRDLLRIGLAQYFAGALLLPYGDFLRQAEVYGYDIDRLGRHFGVGFETVCHRLSTLQRPGALGVPFFFVRVDRAGNISKRQSATDFHFSRVGGSCPLWNVYEAFVQPGRVLTQMAQMPDGRTYLWIARTVGSPGPVYGAPGKTFAIGLGCDIRHAERLVYSQGLNLSDQAAATPIGAGCKICERPACPQRAFPFIGRALQIDMDRSASTPYPTAAAT